ncbi:aldehyde ferredoxin oxidoreductase, partial [Candidatus Bathyarchaeota archaeon]|nr:aldehyde ferredoxin oxidoreductase [Candidatus Bathyarchaeota archaeon]
MVILSLSGRGYVGSVVKVDLSSGKIDRVALSQRDVSMVLGGKGLGALLLYNSTRRGIDPLSPENPLILATGPLTGTLAPSSCRFSIVTKSPHTGLFLDANCGGFFGVEVKKAGFDAVIITGRASQLSMVVVDDGDAYIEEATWLKNLKTMDAEKKVKNKLSEEFRVLTIGPAGEELAPIAGIFTDQRCAGRGGAGAVMGSKNLKAIAVRGRKPITVYDPNGFEKSCWRAHRRLRMHEVTARSLPIYGTVNIIETINEAGALPTKNFKTGIFPDTWKISGYEWRKGLWKKDKACFGCPIACGKLAYSSNYVVDGPDYETLWALGPLCGISDKDAIVYANWLCDAYGVDTISTGVIVSFVMELYERKILASEDIDGMDVEWG